MGMDELFGWKNKSTGVQRRGVETSGACDGGLCAMTHGLMAGTRVASNLGWRAIEAIAIGDMVLTFDHGMREVTEVRRATVLLDGPDTAPKMWPVIVPVGALGNRDELTLLADQGVLVESDAASDIYGDPFAIIPAHTLDGVRGITRVAPAQQVEMIAVYFADEQVIYAEGGALIHCPANLTTLDTFIDTQPANYDVLGVSDAVFLAECLVVEDAVLASGGWVDGQKAAHC